MVIPVTSYHHRILVDRTENIRLVGPTYDSITMQSAVTVQTLAPVLAPLSTLQSTWGQILARQTTRRVLPVNTSLRLEPGVASIT